VQSYTDQGAERINRVYLHVMNNISSPVTLRDVAALTNLSETAFCRYFKAKTGKPFSRFLNEVRIGYACKLLIKSPQSITQIAYESGYNNLANFIIQFKRIMQQTPRQYQSKFRLSGQYGPNLQRPPRISSSNPLSGCNTASCFRPGLYGVPFTFGFPALGTGLSTAQAFAASFR
jgi:AraC-like DNA-binding protein